MDDARPNPWLSWDYVTANWDSISAALWQHTTLTVQAVAIAAAISLPLGVLAQRVARLRNVVLGFTSTLYTIPSLALFALLAAYTGIGRVTVLIGLVAYALVLMVRAVVVGLDGVPPEVTDAARGMGFGRWRLLFRVELPQALPALVSGLRLTAVTTVALATVGVIVGFGGLGQLMQRGFLRGYHAEVATAGLLCVLLALAFDLLIMLAGRAAMPWTRGRRS